MYKRFREFRTPFSLRDIRKNPRSMYARVPQAMAQFVLKIEKLSHIMGPTPILEMVRAYGLRPRLWLLVLRNILRELEVVKLVGREFQRRGPVNFRDCRPYWVVLTEDT